MARETPAQSIPLVVCPYCNGGGRFGSELCPYCLGTGKVESSNPDEEYKEWFPDENDRKPQSHR